MLTFTIENINALLKLYLADPAGKKDLQQDWRNFFTDNFELDRHTVRNLAADRVSRIQEVVNNIVQSGGSIHFSADAWTINFHQTSPLSRIDNSPSSSPNPEMTCNIGGIKVQCYLR